MADAGPRGLGRSLSLGSLVFHGIAFMVPLTVFTTYGLAAQATRGSVPAAYLLASACMVLAAGSYAAMAGASPSAGSAYSYARDAFGPNAGFLTGWAVLLGYAALPALNALASSIFLGPILPEVPAWAWMLGHLGLACGINLLGIQLADRVDRGVVLAQLAFLGLFCYVLIAAIVSGDGKIPAGGKIPITRAVLNIGAFPGPGEAAAALFSGASILALSFLGFDAITTLSEEALRPRKDVPRATILACATAGGAFTVLAVLMQAAWPEAWREMRDPDGGALELIRRVGGSGFGTAFAILYAIGCLASSISAIASASRLLYGMGRSGGLPGKVFARLSGKTPTPAANIVILGLAGLSALGLSLGTAASLVNFGALLAFSAVCASTVRRFYFREGRRTAVDSIRYLILPCVGTAFCLSIWLSLDPSAMRLGSAWLAGGVLVLLARKMKPRPPQESLPKK